MEFTNTKVFNFDGAFRGLRNPMNSWNKSDSWQSDFTDDSKGGFVIGTNDMNLAQQLIRAGSEHRKFLRQITVSVDITAPLYWWKEFDTYKVGITANSTSTMHKLSTTPITLDCFEVDDYIGSPLIYDSYNTDDYGVVEILDVMKNSHFTGNSEWVEDLIDGLELLRKKYLETKDKRYWKELIRWLPSSWLQTRTTTMNYENLYSIIRHRRNHKLTEWSDSFIDWCKTLPYSDELLFLDLEN